MNAAFKISVLQFVKKFQYFIFFSVCSAILVTQIYSCILKYLSVPTYISSYITDQNKVGNKDCQVLGDNFSEALRIYACKEKYE